MKKLLFISLAFMLMNVSAHAIVVNVFTFEFTDDFDITLGTGTLTFETETPTGTFIISALSNFEFDATITAEGFEDSGVLNHFNDSGGEEIILTGSVGSRTIAFNDPVGNVIRFGETDFYIAFSDAQMTAHINNNGDRIEDANWASSDMTAVPEPSGFSLIAGLGLASILLFGRRIR